MPRNRIVAASADFVTSFLATRSPRWLRYHDFQHTVATAVACKIIGKAERLGAEDLEVVMVAGWFHDTGYTVSSIQHEEEGTILARKFLTKEGYPKRKIRKVLDCIMATKFPQRPRGLRERVICDADMVSLGQKTFIALNELLRQETSKRENRTIDEVQWLRRTEAFLQDHRFHTVYGRTVLELGRQRNLMIVRRLLGSRSLADATAPSRGKFKKEKRKKLEAESVRSS